MSQRQISARLPEQYTLKIQALIKELNCSSQRELIMFLIDHYQNNNPLELQKRIKELETEIELEKRAKEYWVYEQKKQTAMLNQMMYGFMPDNDFSVFGEHPFIEKWENQMRNERKKF
ncbi:MAG: hypothetical protein ACRDD4_10600 [Culicoidibacterales bacterium]